MEKKNLFFALDIDAPWPEGLPEGRHLAEGDRHMTLAFLGGVHPFSLEGIPLPNITVGMAGMFDSILFLPPKAAHVVAWQGVFFECREKIFSYQKKLSNWLNERRGMKVNAEREFFPHTTISRGTFNQKNWKEAFRPLPFIATGMHLYESLGYSRYKKIWGSDFISPFEEMDHTADIAFLVRGTTLKDLHLHALTALAFEFPELLQYFDERQDWKNLDAIIIDLNARIGRADAEIGCPLKAISFHGEVKKRKDCVLEWEMIVDV